MVKLPKFLLQKKFMLESVAFVFLFSVIYMFLYKPFSATAWFGFSTWRYALLTLFYYVLAITVMVGSKFLVILVQKRTENLAWFYIFMVLLEFIVLALLYLAITLGFGLSKGHLTALLVLKTSLCVSLILAIPYSFFVLLTAYRSQKDELRLLRAIADPSYNKVSSKRIDLMDDSGSVRLSLDEDTIFYIVSQDNYVKIWYESDGHLVSYMLRCTTQKMEEILAGTDLCRCHRSYFVNVNKVKVLSHTGRRVKIILDHPDVDPIPVSKTYYRTVLSANLPENSVAKK